MENSLRPAQVKIAESLVFRENIKAYWTGHRLMINQGGTSSGKTYSLLQLLIAIAITATTPLLISVMSESFPHLKLGAMRDFQRIMGEQWDENAFNRTDCIYTFASGKGQIEFFSADNPGKVHGPRRDILYVNEVNNVPKRVFDAASIRTNRAIFTDYNPTEQFYLMDEIGKEGVAFIKSTYLDAKQFLPEAIVKDIEARRESDPNWWNIYGLGEVGNVEGLVHPLFSQVDDMPEGGYDFFGLDFGFSSDPTALIHNCVIGTDLYSDVLIYERGLQNNQIAAYMEEAGIQKRHDEIFADAADPKSIDELHEYGYNVKACPKGEDSVRNGIQLVNQYRQHWTKRSTPAIKEQRNYRYIVDKNGNITNKPIDNWNHAMDARRYAVVGKASTNPGWAGLVAI
jgi:phage terminase large subunit